MEATTKKKRGLVPLYMLCPVRHTLLLLCTLAVLAHLLTRGNKAWMLALSEGFVRPAHRFLGKLCSFYSGSIAEAVILFFVLITAAYILCSLLALLFSRGRLRRLYRLFITLVTLALFIYALFCLMWGVYYYGEDFMTRSGLDSREISTRELETVTAYFARLCNESSTRVRRNANRTCATDRDAVLAKSPEVFREAQALFPCLEGDELAAKGIYCSRALSYFDFTGFFFPFTGEANVNTDSPAAFFASTVAHELSHQRGVAKEQEANFASVLACMSCGDGDYLYSGCLLAYVHLGNALYQADRQAWKQVYDGLNENVLADLAFNRAYWQQFDTPVQTLSNTVYEGFLQSYDQTLGLKSYGACVDLLVNYYYGEAAAAMGA